MTRRRPPRLVRLAALALVAGPGSAAFAPAQGPGNAIGSDGRTTRVDCDPAPTFNGGLYDVALARNQRDQQCVLVAGRELAICMLVMGARNAECLQNSCYACDLRGSGKVRIRGLDALIGARLTDADLVRLEHASAPPGLVAGVRTRCRCSEGGRLTRPNAISDGAGQRTIGATRKKPDAWRAFATQSDSMQLRCSLKIG